MESVYVYTALSGMLCVLLWTPYILSRALTWGLGSFLHNYPDGYPAREPEPPLWAQRAKRAHLNLVETLPAFIAVVLAAGQLAEAREWQFLASAAQLFFYARLGHALVYILGIPYLRTPVYLVSWAAVLAIGLKALS